MVATRAHAKCATCSSCSKTVNLKRVRKLPQFDWCPVPVIMRYLSLMSSVGYNTRSLESCSFNLRYVSEWIHEVVFKRCQQNHLILNTRTLSMEPTLISLIYISRAPLPPTLIVFPPFQMPQRDTMLLLSILCLALVGHGVALKVSTGYQIVHNEQPHGGNYHGFRYLQGPDPYLVG